MGVGSTQEGVSTGVHLRRERQRDIREDYAVNRLLHLWLRTKHDGRQQTGDHRDYAI